MSEATITNPGAGAPNPTTPASDTSGHGLFAADRKWVTPVLVVALVVIFVGSLIIGGIRTAGQDETFVGTDSAATEAAEEADQKASVEAATSYTAATPEAPAEEAGSLASDEALQALRDKLSGN